MERRAAEESERLAPRGVARISSFRVALSEGAEASPKEVLGARFGVGRPVAGIEEDAAFESKTATTDTPGEPVPQRLKLSDATVKRATR